MELPLEEKFEYLYDTDAVRAPDFAGGNPDPRLQVEDDDPVLHPQKIKSKSPAFRAYRQELCEGGWFNVADLICTLSGISARAEDDENKQGCTSMGRKIASGLVRNASTRIFAQKEQSVTELISNGIDATPRLPEEVSSDSVGKFGFGAYSHFAFLYDDPTALIILETTTARSEHTKIELRVNADSSELIAKVVSYEQPHGREWDDYLNERVENPNIPPPFHRGTKISLTTSIPIDQEAVLREVERFRYFGFSTSAEPYTGKRIGVYYGTNAEQRQINTGLDHHITRRNIRVICEPYLLEVQDNGVGMSLTNVLRYFLIPSVTKKRRTYVNQPNSLLGASVAPSMLSIQSGSETGGSMAIIVGGVTVVIAETNTDTHITVMFPVKQRVTIGRDDVLLSRGSITLLGEKFGTWFAEQLLNPVQQAEREHDRNSGVLDLNGPLATLRAWRYSSSSKQQAGAVISSVERHFEALILDRGVFTLHRSHRPLLQVLAAAGVALGGFVLLDSLDASLGERELARRCREDADDCWVSSFNSDTVFGLLVPAEALAAAPPLDSRNARYGSEYLFVYPNSPEFQELPIPERIRSLYLTIAGSSPQMLLLQNQFAPETKGGFGRALQYAYGVTGLNDKVTNLINMCTVLLEVDKSLGGGRLLEVFQEYVFGIRAEPRLIVSVASFGVPMFFDRYNVLFGGGEEEKEAHAHAHARRGHLAQGLFLQRLIRAGKTSVLRGKASVAGYGESATFRSELATFLSIEKDQDHRDWGNLNITELRERRGESEEAEHLHPPADTDTRVGLVPGVRPGAYSVADDAYLLSDEDYAAELEELAALRIPSPRWDVFLSSTMGLTPGRAHTRRFLEAKAYLLEKFSVVLVRLKLARSFRLDWLLLEKTFAALASCVFVERLATAERSRLLFHLVLLESRTPCEALLVLLATIRAVCLSYVHGGAAPGGADRDGVRTYPVSGAEINLRAASSAQVQLIAKALLEATSLRFSADDLESMLRDELLGGFTSLLSLDLHHGAQWVHPICGSLVDPDPTVYVPQTFYSLVQDVRDVLTINVNADKQVYFPHYLTPPARAGRLGRQDMQLRLSRYISETFAREDADVIESFRSVAENTGRIGSTAAQKPEAWPPLPLNIASIAINEGTSKTLLLTVLTELVQNSVDACRSNVQVHHRRPVFGGNIALGSTAPPRIRQDAGSESDIESASEDEEADEANLRRRRQAVSTSGVARVVHKTGRFIRSLWGGGGDGGGRNERHDCHIQINIGFHSPEGSKTHDFGDVAVPEKGSKADPNKRGDRLKRKRSRRPGHDSASAAEGPRRMSMVESARGGGGGGGGGGVEPLPAGKRRRRRGRDIVRTRGMISLAAFRGRAQPGELRARERSRRPGPGERFETTQRQSIAPPVSRTIRLEQQEQSLGPQTMRRMGIVDADAAGDGGGAGAESEAVGAGVVIEVADSVGIPQSALPSLLIPYYSSKDSSQGITTGEMGNGLFNVYRSAQHVRFVTKHEDDDTELTIDDRPMIQRGGTAVDVQKTIRLRKQGGQKKHGTSISVFMPPDVYSFSANLVQLRALVTEHISLVRWPGIRLNTNVKLVNEGVYRKDIVLKRSHGLGIGMERDAVGYQCFRVYFLRDYTRDSYILTNGIPFRKLGDQFGELGVHQWLRPFLQTGIVVDVLGVTPGPLGSVDRLESTQTCYTPVQSRAKLTLKWPALAQLQGMLLDAAYTRAVINASIAAFGNKGDGKLDIESYMLHYRSQAGLSQVGFDMELARAKFPDNMETWLQSYRDRKPPTLSEFVAFYSMWPGYSIAEVVTAADLYLRYKQVEAEPREPRNKCILSHYKEIRRPSKALKPVRLQQMILDLSRAWLAPKSDVKDEEDIPPPLPPRVRPEHMLDETEAQRKEREQEEAEAERKRLAEEVERLMQSKLPPRPWEREKGPGESDLHTTTLELGMRLLLEKYIAVYELRGSERGIAGFPVDGSRMVDHVAFPLIEYDNPVGAQFSAGEFQGNPVRQVEINLAHMSWPGVQKLLRQLAEDTNVVTATNNLQQNSSVWGQFFAPRSILPPLTVEQKRALVADSRLVGGEPDAGLRVGGAHAHTTVASLLAHELEHARQNTTHDEKGQSHGFVEIGGRSLTFEEAADYVCEQVYTSKLGQPTFIEQLLGDLQGPLRELIEKDGTIVIE